MYDKPESLRLTDKVREELSEEGAYVALSDGVTHYRIDGEGEWVVLVHGYATPLFIYDKIVEGLTAAGYKTLRYDLFGRGLSDRPKKRNDPDFFRRQLKELIGAVLPGEKFHLIATSMGGIIATSFVAAHPENVRSLTLLAPAGMEYPVPTAMRLCKLPAIGELLFTIAKNRQIIACAAEMYKSGEKTQEEYRRKFASYARFKGQRRSTLSSLRHTLLNFKQARVGYTGTASSGIPILVIWGTEDRTVPYSQSQPMRNILRRATFLTYEGSGHIFLYDEGEKTVKDVLKFLQSYDVFRFDSQ